jgi:chromosome segregation ATPase
MTEKHWAYCPDRNGVCAIVIADAERAERDATRIATLGADLDQALAELDQARSDVERAAADENANARDLARARAEIRDLERENAALRRRLREGGR